ncbi:hypothetical protein SNEBB_007145 [Seison nebaliae]|nr:hypothetical protein SNEBB_007145 [Seison nebaliae]
MSSFCTRINHIERIFHSNLRTTTGDCDRLKRELAAQTLINRMRRDIDLKIKLFGEKLDEHHLPHLRYANNEEKEKEEASPLTAVYSDNKRQLMIDLILFGLRVSRNCCFRNIPNNAHFYRHHFEENDIQFFIMMENGDSFNYELKGEFPCDINSKRCSITFFKDRIRLKIVKSENSSWMAFINTIPDLH